MEKGHSQDGTSPGAYPTRTCKPTKTWDSISLKSAATSAGIAIIRNAPCGLSPNNVCYSRIVRSASIPNNIHITLVMLASAFLVSICVQESRPLAAPSPIPVALPAAAVIALTTCEVRHLLAHLIWPAPTSAALICQWSWWRRVHQYWAGYSHRRRRLKAS
jgi:hypothetical protein